jgi:thioredoxin reductase
MNERHTVVVVGAGPAGMAAASVVAEHGVDVLLLDEQPTPGGQIYRSIGQRTHTDAAILGADYYRGERLVSALGASGAVYAPDSTVWQLSPQREIGVSRHGDARLMHAEQVILATGAQERPFPVPGWTLPGVMTAGGAQVLLKSAGLAAQDAVFIGTGPLLYLVAHQYLKAGAPPRAILDTTPRENLRRALWRLPGALANLTALSKGRRWIADLRAAGIALVKYVDDVKLVGRDALSWVDFKCHGHRQRMEAAHAFLHQGIVPSVNLAMAAGCAHRWSTSQLCWHAHTDAWGETDLPGIAIAGDGAAIDGALAAECLGRIAALGALHRCGRIAARDRDRLAQPHRQMLARERRTRAFLDTLFRPAKQFRVPPDAATLVCRCEEISVADIRACLALACTGPNQLKGVSRCGMGACQGRFCGLTVSEMIADFRRLPVEEVGALRMRPPVKPLVLAELAALTAGAQSDHGNH